MSDFKIILQVASLQGKAAQLKEAIKYNNSLLNEMKEGVVFNTANRDYNSDIEQLEDITVMGNQIQQQIHELDFISKKLQSYD
jgi:hypothetical protein